jgi:hypothetical protein
LQNEKELTIFYGVFLKMTALNFIIEIKKDFFTVDTRGHKDTTITNTEITNYSLDKYTVFLLILLY